MITESPIRYVHDNLIFTQQLGEIWGLYRLDEVSYAGLSLQNKTRVFEALDGLLYRLGHDGRDFQILRVSREWCPENYASSCAAGMDPRFGHPDLLSSYLSHHGRALTAGRINIPECYIAVRLATAAANPLARYKTLAGVPGRWQRIKDAMQPMARTISGRELDTAITKSNEVLSLLEAYTGARAATSSDVAWLVRRAYVRGVGDPARPQDWRPQALVVDDPAGNLTITPEEHDVVRLFEEPITLRRRGLEFDTLTGECHQAILVLGAMPEVMLFEQADLLFSPLAGLDFSVDACVWGRHISNQDAVTLVRRKVIDADNAWQEESLGDHGPSSLTAERPSAARALQAHLQSNAHPPMFRATISLAVGAPTEQELEHRIQQLQLAYGSIPLHRPAGNQLELWAAHLPGQDRPVPDYEEPMIIPQLACLAPHASEQVGSDTGPYLAHTLSGARQPVLFDLTEASRSNRPPAMLLCGTLGSGKTMALMNMLYQSFLLGSLVVAVDPKGDNHLDRLPGVAEHCEVIELGGDPRYQGLLDPLVIAPAQAAVDAAMDWLIGLLPPGTPGEWLTELRRAVTEVHATDPNPTCMAVVNTLTRSETPAASAVGEALSVHAESGFSRLGFAPVGTPAAGGARKQVTILRLRDLPLTPGVSRENLREAERIGQAVLQLTALFALHICAKKPRDRHVAIGLDEAWFLLQDHSGRRLIEQLNRWGRSEFATPLLVTHLIADAASIDNLLGARLFLGQETEEEAASALRLLHLDPEDAASRRALLSYREGRGYLRDYRGRTAAIQIHVANPAVLRALDTNPHADREDRQLTTGRASS